MKVNITKVIVYQSGILYLSTCLYKCIRWTKVSSTIQHSIWCAYWTKWSSFIVKTFDRREWLSCNQLLSNNERIVLSATQTKAVSRTMITQSIVWNPTEVTPPSIHHEQSSRRHIQICFLVHFHGYEMQVDPTSVEEKVASTGSMEGNFLRHKQIVQSSTLGYSGRATYCPTDFPCMAFLDSWQGTHWLSIIPWPEMLLYMREQWV